MLSVSDNKTRTRARSAQEPSSLKTQELKGKIANTSKDDSFMDNINWDAIPKSTFLQDAKSEIFSHCPITSENCPEFLPEPLQARGRTASAPIPRPDSDSKIAYDDTDHHYPMTKITKRLFLGNDHDASDEAALRKAKITHVLSMVARKWDEKPRGTFDWKPKIFDWKKDIKRMCVPLRDDGKSDVIKLLEKKELWKFITNSQKKKKKLLIHCQMGMNRSPTMVMGFLMKYENITFHQAWRKVKKKRIIVQPHAKYIRQLRTWDMYLHGSYSTPDDFLEMKVSDEGISVLHENADTKRMKYVMVESGKILQDASTLNDSWDSSVDMGSPFSPFSLTTADLLGPGTFITVEPCVPVSDVESAASPHNLGDLSLD